MQLKLLIILTFLAMSCGSDDSSSSSDEPRDVPQSSPETDAGKNLQSIYLESERDLPVCDDEINSQLAYVADTDRFHACLDGSWQVVDVRGEDGEDGQTITQDVDPDPFTIWTDSVTTRQWVTGNIVQAASATCPAGYEVPDVNDLQEGQDNGLLAELDAFEMNTHIWAKNLSDGVVESYRDLYDMSYTNTTTGYARLFCVTEN